MGRCLIFFLLFCSITAFADGDRRGVILHWLPVQEAVKYEFELSDSNGFTTLRDKKLISTTHLQMNLLPGSYFYRVRGVHPLSGPGPWSESRALAVNPFPPTLLSPIDRSNLYLSPSKRNVALKWKAGLSGSAYILEIEKAGEKISKKKVSDTRSEERRVGKECRL